MLINFTDHLHQLNNYRKGKTKKALKIDQHEFDSAFRFVHGNMNMILGHNNVGKTHFIFYLMLLYTQKHNIRWLVFSSENEPYSLIKKLVEFIEGKPINKIEEADYNKHTEYVNNHFKFVDCNRQYTHKELLELATNIKNAWDYDGLLIDPINSLRKDIKVGSNGYQYSYESLTDIRIFCKANQIATWINCHAVTEALRKRHEKGHSFSGQPIPPMIGDAEGGAVNGNRCDDFLIIHRYIYDQIDWIYTRLYVAKVKYQELGYRPTSIENPLMFKSILNNVGFELNGKNLVTYVTKEQLKAL